MRNKVLKILSLTLVLVVGFSIFSVGCKKKTGSLNGESNSETESGKQDNSPESEGGEKESQNENIEPPKGELEFTLNDDGHSYSVSGIGTFEGKEIVIPSSFNGLDVTKISNQAFKSNLEIKKVVIPNTVKIIGVEAFGYCQEIKSVDFGLGLEEIGLESFVMCTSLTNLVIPNSVKNISENAFKHCTNLATVEIGDSVTYIGKRSFAFCSNLIKVTIGKSVTSIDRNAFFANNKLVEVCNKSILNIEKGSTENGLVGRNAEHIYNPERENGRVSVTDNGCVLYTYEERVVIMAYNGGEDIPTIPEGVTEIFPATFFNAVSGVVVPKTLTNVTCCVFGYDASDISKIFAVYYFGNAEDWAKIKVIDGDNEYSDLFEIPRYYYSETKPTEDGNFWHYDSNGNILIW